MLQYFKLQIAILFVIVLSFSCIEDNNTKVFTSIVIKNDYIDNISVPGTIQTSRNNTILCPRIQTDATVKYLIDEGTIVKKGDTLCILDAPSILSDYLNAEINLESVMAEIVKSKTSMDIDMLLLKSNLEEVETNAQISFMDSLQKKFSTSKANEIKELELQKIEIEREIIHNKIVSQEQINQLELKRLEIRLEQEKNRMARSEEQFKKLIITSPIDGMVFYCVHWETELKIREGDVVWDNMPIVEIPDFSSMQIVINVNEVNFKRIQKDQLVKMTVDALPEIMLTGKVLNINPMGKPVRRNSEIKMFEIIATIDSINPLIKPGLSVSCNIIFESFKDTIIVPQIAIYQEDSLNFVYILDNKKFKKQKVELAYTNSNIAVVKKGLNIDDVFALKKPEYNLIEIEK